MDQPHRVASDRLVKDFETRLPAILIGLTARFIALSCQSQSLAVEGAVDRVCRRRDAGPLLEG